jgi:Phosphotransferase system mannitol/fructose-specific IIA domain (Ntr-type)
MSPHRLTLEQAADFLQMDTSELMSMAVQGEIPCQQQGKRYFFEQDALDAWCSQKIIKHSVTRKKNGDKKKKPSNPRTTVPEEAEEEPIIAQLCSEDLMETDMQAKSMPAVLKELVKIAEKSGYLYDPQDLYNELHAREEEASTAIDFGVAIPHPNRKLQIELFSDPFICIAKLEQPIFYGATALHNEKTDIFFLVCCMDSDLHLKLLQRICILCAETSLVQDLRDATSPSEMMKIITAIDSDPKSFPKDQPLS